MEQLGPCFLMSICLTVLLLFVHGSTKNQCKSLIKVPVDYKKYIYISFWYVKLGFISILKLFS